ncbi:HNH endonuclease family protein [Stenotrophomonas pigmentata]|uniref:hypothetical protein n=1 Tax=Stenotrophomonas pigmentata TaxID=3055080 RepID=UPI0026EA202B|nr:hypothetical protein [Stenotrophomonas sp. 610A2]
MRWICKADIEECLTQAWRESAASARQELLDAADSAARKVILRKVASSDIWRSFYELLPENLKKKCWYCESTDIRADTPVDHFRPKNKVESVLDHSGYWWLAFEWTNYRCACTFCNSKRVFDETVGGKACKFPLVNPERRAFSPTDIQELDDEIPDFLDPFNPDDEKLLWFDRDGKPESKPEATEEEVRKVSNSIEMFHLHETRIVRARNRIRINIESEVKKIREGREVIQAKTALRKMVRDSETLSRAAVVYLRQHRDLAEVTEILRLD